MVIWIQKSIDRIYNLRPWLPKDNPSNQPIPDKGSRARMQEFNHSNHRCSTNLNGLVLRLSKVRQWVREATRHDAYRGLFLLLLPFPFPVDREIDKSNRRRRRKSRTIWKPRFRVTQREKNRKFISRQRGQMSDIYRAEGEALPVC